MPRSSTDTPKLSDGASNARRLARAVFRPLELFLRIEGASGIALALAVALALAWANSRWAASYAAVWDGALRIGPLEATPRFAVNEGLMTLFFFVVGLELRRERAYGELSERRRAILPVFAALGGMLAPALIYLAMNRGVAARGWGIPVATDIAFALGVLALAGRGLPPSLRVFLLALAIVDDLGAIVVVAVFYSRGVAPGGLAVAALGIAAILAMQRGRVRWPVAYVVPAAVIWCGLHRAHVHPTLAGVIVGLMTPIESFADEARGLAPPGIRLEESLHPWVAFGVMPAFALANAGVDLGALHVTEPGILAGIALGLVLGKPLGIASASALAVRLGVASLPTGATWRGMILVGTVAGIGFTMSLFIAELAFGGRPDLHAEARLGLLAGSAVAILAALALRWLVRRDERR